jgi:hypothetical protein
MAKISTYPNASSPQLSDILIGSEVGDGNATKNFTIASIIGLVDLSNFVPYTGAIDNVDLGSYGLTADSVIVADGLAVLAGLAQFNGPIQAIGSLTIDSQLIDGLGNPGTTGQLLSTNGSEIIWTTYGLQEVLDAGDTANNVAIVLTGTSSMTAPGIESQTALIVGGTLEDYDSSVGTAGQVLSSTGIGVEWVDIASILNSYKGSFYDNLTQNLTGGANVAVPVILRQTDAPATNGVSVVTDGTNLTRITVANAGVYNILFSAQLTNSGGSAQTVDFWLRKNGATAAFNVPDSNGKVQLQGNASYLMAAWNYFIALNAGDYVYLMWTATSTNVTMISAPTNGVHPATPSIIVTINNV